MKPTKTTRKGFQGGKRSGSIRVRRYGSGGGGGSLYMGKTQSAPFVIATWNGVNTLWGGLISFWR
jgi:hypothetical protein